jgi:hypothetical protein
MFIRFALALCFSGLPLIITSTPAQAQAVPSTATTVDWQRGVVTATGYGKAADTSSSPGKQRADAMRAAQADAYRRLAEVVGQVQVFPDATVDSYLQQDEAVRRQVSALLKGVKVKGTRYLPDKSVEIDLEMPLFGANSVAQGLNFGQLLQRRASAPQSTQPVRLASLQALLPYQQASAYTGLIIDASGLGFNPVMGPLVMQNSALIYPTQGLEPERINNMGLVQYATSLANAHALTERIGSQPLVLRATQTDKGTVHLPENSTLEASTLSALKVVIVY